MPGRALLLGGAAGLAVLLAIPVVTSLVAPAPLTGSTRHAASGQEPTPLGSADPSPVAMVVGVASESAAPTVSPTTAPPALGPTVTPVSPEPTVTKGQTVAPTTEPATPRPATAAPATPRPTPSPTPTPKATPAATPLPTAADAAPAPASGPPAAAWTGSSDAPAVDTLTGYRWPLAHPRLTLPFGPSYWGSRVVGGEPFHDGMDIATFCNDRIMAAHSGTVLAAGRHFDDFMGWVGSLDQYYRRLDKLHIWSQLPIVVVIDDGNGYRSMYAHMWKITVKPGDTVEAGDLIGYEGMTGRASGCHLHYGLFSPLETSRFKTKPDVARRMKVPMREIARVDPLDVLPKKAGINAPAKPKAEASPAPAPSPAPATSPAPASDS